MTRDVPLALVVLAALVGCTAASKGDREDASSRPDAETPEPTPDASATPDFLPSPDVGLRDGLTADVSLLSDAEPPDAGPSPEDLEEQARLFGAREVIAVSIELTPDARASLMADPRGDYVPARVTVDGVVFERVGLRLKGGRGSFRGIDQKAGFKIELDHYRGASRLAGLRKLTFNNMIQDRSKMRERLASLIFEALGLPASRVGYAEISVDGVNYGLYSHVETPDEVFLARVFPGDSTGNLYEGADDEDLWLRFLDSLDRDAGADGSRADLRALIGALDQSTPATFESVVGARLDLDATRRFFAAEILTGHWDGYAQLRNNYYVYSRPSDGRFVFLPWGTDQTFERTRDAFDGQGRVFRMCSDWLPCRQRYAQTVEALAVQLQAMDLGPEIDALQALTEEPFSRDRKTPTRAQQRTDAIAELRRFVVDHPGTIVESLTCLDAASDRDGDLCASCSGDCNDADPTVFAHAPDACGDEVDQDCSGFTDDGQTCPACRRVHDELAGDFLLCHRLERWTTGRDTCAKYGATLAALRTQQEQDFVAAAALARRRTRWWIGARDGEEEGRFTWTDGSPVDFAAWKEGEPNNNGGLEDCVAIGDGTGSPLWNDLYCGYYLPFICRVR